MADRSAASQAKRNPDLADLTIAVACALGAATTLLFLAIMPLNRHLAGARDFVIYWATGQQLAHHASPYDPDQMRALEHGAGFSGKAYLVNYMRNPPWGLPLTLPLGFLNAQAAALPWSLLMLMLLIVSVRLLWNMFGRAQSHLIWLGFCFPPALVCIMMGQTSLFVLLGLVLFLRLHRTQPFWSGVALSLCTLKPHLFVPFGIVLLLWVAGTRKYRVLTGSAAAVAVSAAVTTLIDPHAWSQYHHWTQTSGISSEFQPCLGVALRNLIDMNATWLAFLPCVLGSAWALWYYNRHRHDWDWVEHGSLVMLVSIVVAPYCWFYDQSLALPALLYGALRTRSRAVLAILGLFYLAVDVQPFLSPEPETALYLWTAPAWLAWFAWEQWTARREVAVDMPSAVSFS
jgi:hypothetical protein